MCSIYLRILFNRATYNLNEIINTTQYADVSEANIHPIWIRANFDQTVINLTKPTTVTGRNMSKHKTKLTMKPKKVSKISWQISSTVLLLRKRGIKKNLFGAPKPKSWGQNHTKRRLILLDYFGQQTCQRNCRKGCLYKFEENRSTIVTCIVPSGSTLMVI